MMDRGDDGSAVSVDLLINADALFELWSKVRSGEHSRATFAAETLPLLRVLVLRYCHQRAEEEPLFRSLFDPPRFKAVRFYLSVMFNTVVSYR